MGQSANTDSQINLLMDVMVDAIIVTDSEGVITHFNSAAGDMFGWSADDAIGSSINVLMPGSEATRHDGYITNYLRTGKRKIIGIGRDLKAVRKDGTQFDIHLSIGEVRTGETRRFIGVIRDIRERKLAEERVIKRQDEIIQVGRLTTMGEMAAAMAHELNQPLTAISNYSNACTRLIDQPDTDLDDVRAGLSSINEQAHRAAEIIRRLRDFVQYDSTTREDVQPDELISEILPLAEVDAKANNISLEVEIPDDLPKLHVDRLQIQQVILNLVRNGVDSMAASDPDHRRLIVKCMLMPEKEILFEVVDFGSGVPDYLRAELFDAFVTTKSEGMGMGLAICRKIIQSHGGFLNYRNNPDDTGATFYFTIPVKNE